jgi:hypothetical protein
MARRRVNWPEREAFIALSPLNRHFDFVAAGRQHSNSVGRSLRLHPPISRRPGTKRRHAACWPRAMQIGLIVPGRHSSIRRVSSREALGGSPGRRFGVMLQAPWSAYINGRPPNYSSGGIVHEQSMTDQNQEFLFYRGDARLGSVFMVDTNQPYFAVATAEWPNVGTSRAWAERRAISRGEHR